MILTGEQMEDILRIWVDTGVQGSHWDTCHRSHWQCAIVRLVETAKHYKAQALAGNGPISEGPQG